MLSALFLATVIGISDGDTLTVLNQNKQQVKYRLAESTRRRLGSLSAQVKTIALGIVLWEAGSD